MPEGIAYAQYQMMKRLEQSFDAIVAKLEKAGPTERAALIEVLADLKDMHREAARWCGFEKLYSAEATPPSVRHLRRAKKVA